MVSQELLRFMYLYVDFTLTNVIIYRLYPVDKSRPDVDVIGEETVNSENSNKKTE